MSWKYVSEEELAAMRMSREVAPCDVSLLEITNQIFPVAWKGRIRAGGEDYEIEQGTPLKLLPGPREEVGCYEVVDVSVILPGGSAGSLKPGAWVALLPDDFRKTSGTADTNA